MGVFKLTQGFTGEQQVVGYVVTGGLPITQGDFTLSFNGQTTGDIPYNATAAQVQTALAGLSTIGSGNVMVTGGVSGDLNAGLTGADLYTIDFTGAFGGGDTTLPKLTIQSAADNALKDSDGQTSDVALEAYALPPAAAATAAPASAAAQQLVITAASGSFTLGFQTETTASIDLPTTAAAVQAALAALPLIGTGNVQVIGSGTWASPFYVSFTGDMAGQNLPPLTLTSSSSVANTVVTSYNADSQTATIGDNFSDYAYQYDGQGNTATVDNAGTPGVPDVLLTSVYDGMGNRTSLAASIGGVKDFINNYSYDALSRLYDVIQQSQTGGNAVAPKQVYYKLDGIGDVTEIDRSTSTEIGPNPNGFANSILSYWPTTGQLKAINHESGGVSVDDLTYTYDGVGRVSTFGSIDGSATYTYDPMSQLKSATYTTASGGHQPANESFSFDTNGNRPAANGTTTTDNEVADDGTFHYTFDGAGNRLTRTRDSSAPANDYEVSYTWDAANRLVEVQNFNNADTLTEQINYTYDVFDHLIERIDAISGGATTTTHYLWDDAAGSGGIVLALNGAGNVTNRYLNGPNTSAYDQFFSTLAEENDTATPAVVTWDLLDAEGGLRDVISSTGAVLDHLNYNSFGNVTYESAPSVSHIDGYAGGLYDPSTGLVYFIHRWYDPLATVWISVDQSGFGAGDTDLTRYVGNNVTNEVDPTGLAPRPRKFGEQGAAGHTFVFLIVGGRPLGQDDNQAGIPSFKCFRNSLIKKKLEARVAEEKERLGRELTKREIKQAETFVNGLEGVATEVGPLEATAGNGPVDRDFMPAIRNQIVYDFGFRNSDQLDRALQNNKGLLRGYTVRIIFVGYSYGAMKANVAADTLFPQLKELGVQVQVYLYPLDGVNYTEGTLGPFGAGDQPLTTGPGVCRTVAIVNHYQTNGTVHGAPIGGAATNLPAMNLADPKIEHETLDDKVLIDNQPFVDEIFDLEHAPFNGPAPKPASAPSR